MRIPEDELILILKKSGVDLVSTLPCERVKNLLVKVDVEFENIPLTREENGVGISAGAALGGRRPAMIIQNSGIGNMINALLSLTTLYQLPLAIFLSHRGIYREKIKAQIPMGKHVPGILKASGIGYTMIRSQSELHKIIRPLERVYRESRVHAFLLSPKIWEVSGLALGDTAVVAKRSAATVGSIKGVKPPPARLTRYEVINAIAPFLKNRLVICNLGFPAKELYHVLHQPSNFYMLGSMGMATPIGYGLAISCKKEVIVIDGDGSLLMNPGALSTIALRSPDNLTVIVIDNGVYSSTGDQATAANSVTNLSVVAQGFGIKNVITVSRADEILAALKNKKRGAKVIHVIARRGNMKLPNIPVSAKDIRNNFMLEVMS